MKNNKIKIKELADKKEMTSAELQDYLEKQGYDTVINNLPPTPPYIDYKLEDLVKVWDILKNYL